MANYSDLKRQKSLSQQTQDNSPYSAKNTAAAKSTPKVSGKRTSSGGSFDSSSPSEMPVIADARSGSLTDELGLTKRSALATNAIPAASETGEQRPMTFADYLQAAQQLLGGQTTSTPDLSSYDTQLSAVKGSGTDADAKLAAMYQQLQGSFDSAAPGIQKQYQGTKTAQAANSDQATAAINQGYGAATDSLTAMLQKLGIGDAAGVIANKGTSLQGDQARALGNVQQNKAATLNHTDNNGAAALDYNRGIGQAAQLGGAEARATNQENLQKQIASILAAKQQASQQARTSGPSASDYTSLAQQMYENDQANDPNSLANQLKAEGVANSVNKTQQSASAQKASEKKQLSSTYTALLNTYNGDADKANTVLQQMQKSGLL